MQEAGIEEVEEYVPRIQNMVAQYISTRRIIDLCEETLWRPGMQVSKRWWEQEGLYPEEARRLCYGLEHHHPTMITLWYHVGR